MAVAKLEPALSVGEVSPDLFGRFDLARMAVAAATMRNMQVHYTGGAMSRGGTMFVGFSKQTGRDYPPRLITFQFNINQGLALEFGHQYMRVISNGAFVTEPPIAISGITNGAPAVVSSAGSGAVAATANTGSVITSYAPGDLVTLAGGTFLSPAILSVTNTKLKSLVLNNPGVGNYVPGDTVNLDGGTMSTTAVITVQTTQVVSATIANAGAGGTDGTQTVTGTTGTGTKFQASVTIAGGLITAILSITVGGSYTANPTTPATEPVTGAGAGAQLDVVLGINTFAITNTGIFTVNATSGAFTQASSSGPGTGATFQQGIFSPNVVAIDDPGVYTVQPANPVSQLTTTGSGMGATFTLNFASIASFSDGDWVQISGVLGMTEVNGQTYVIQNATATDFEIYDVYGNPIDTTAFAAYAGGGTVARIYTVAAPYAEQDLQFLKWTQSKDVMSICCVNQDTQSEYPTYDLERHGNTDWVFTLTTLGATVDPPTNVSGVASSSGSTFYQYAVTAVSPDDGSESVSSDIIQISNAVNISATAGTITITWTPQSGVKQYNVYKALPSFSAAPPPGSQFGFAGFAFGAQFKDSNITANFSQVPPLHKDPFARGAIDSVDPATGGTGYTTATVTIVSATGSGADIEAIIVGGSVVAYIVNDGGKDYMDGDTATITGDGSGATASLSIGPDSGTYPGVVSYFQERRVYAYTLNSPDTFFMSQPEAFKNFDSRIPTIDSDAIIGSPWSTQVDGVQFMVPMPGGLVVLTGKDAWQLTGTGGSSLNPQPITPLTQQAQPQAFNGCHSHIPPIKIDYDILYVQAKGAIVRDLAYQFYTNIYTGSDLTVNSSHLFAAQFAGTEGVLVEWAWCEEPYKTAWVVRGDGSMLSLAFMKPQEIAGWARHDTNGLFKSVCAVTEPPVDALYAAVQRFPGANTAYMIERMDNRIWDVLDDAWCVDCGLSLAQTEPDATLTISNPYGLGAVTGVVDLVSGSGWSDATTAVVIDKNDDDEEGPGTGAVPTLTITAGVITAITFAPGNEGTRYRYPKIIVSDPAGSAGGDPGAFSATCVLDNSATFTTDADVFQLTDVGSVIRAAKGVATITTYNGPREVIANITTPLSAIRPNSATDAMPDGYINPQPSGLWTMTVPVGSVGGGQHLAGMTVTGVADGVKIPAQVMPASGTIPLPQDSTNVVIGLAFGAQVQSVYLDGGEPTIQGQRKKVAAATIRVRNSYDFEVGSNQVDGSTLSPQVLQVDWQDMQEAVVPSIAPFGSNVRPLYNGDCRVPVGDSINTRGQVAVQQLNPFPLELLAIVPESLPGDSASVKWPTRETEKQAA